jgi:hypothetical protein
MKLINLQAFGHALLVVAAFAAAGTIAGEKADALPVTTVNSAEFRNDVNLGGGLDGLQKDRKIITPATVGVYSYVADSPRIAGDTVIVAPTATSHGTYGYAGSKKRDEHDAVIRQAVASKTKTDRPITSEGYVKLSKKIGNDTTIGAVYYKDAIAPELAVKTGNLALAAGYQFGDRHSVTGSAAYSIGDVSPFVAYRDKAMHYGAELQMGNSSAIQIAYRPDGNQYSAGLRFDIGTNPIVAPKVAEVLPVVNTIAPPPKPDNKWCANGFEYNESFGGCAKKIAPLYRQYIKGRG